MRRGAKIAGWVTAITAFVPFGLAALLASVASLPHQDGTSTPFLVWPLKIVVFVLAILASALLGLMVTGIVTLAAKLVRR